MSHSFPPQLVALLLAWSLVRSALAAPVYFVQISDVHLSDFNVSRAASFGNPFEDLRLLSKTALKAMQPAAVLITGDLVDGKDKKRRGRQSLTEWQDYRTAIEFLKSEAGLEERQILDIRGNHDTFNVPFRLGSEDFFPRFAAEGRRNATARVHLHHLPVGKLTGCPDVSLVGIDASKDPGFSGINFFGTGSVELLSEADLVLQQAGEALRQRGCSPFFVAYGHFPLGVIAHPDLDPWWLFARLRPSHLSQPYKTLKQLLLRHEVTAYLNGHLHSAFGQKLHRLHPAPSGRYLAELETAAWTNDRRFRVVAADESSLSFTDLFLTTATRPATKTRAPARLHASGDQSFGVAAVDATQKVVDHIVLITSPPHARYSPLLGAGVSALRRAEAVRALVLPVDQEAANAGFELTVRFELECRSSGQVRSGDLIEKRGSNLWEGALPILSCPDALLHLQVLTSQGSTSERRPVSVLREEGSAVLGEADRPLKLELSWFDWFRSVALAVEWPHGSYWMMTGIWGLHFFGLLLIPRLALVFAPSPELWVNSRRSWRSRFRNLLLYPVAAFMDMASLPQIWLPQAVVSAWLGFGPWAVGPVLKGEGPAWIFLGRVLYFRGGSPHFDHSVDTAINTFIYTVFGLMPVTCTVAASAFRFKRRSEASGFRVLSLLQLLFVLIFLYWYYVFTKHFAFHGFGVAGGFLASGFGLTVSFLALLLLRLQLSPRISHTRNVELAALSSGTSSSKSE